MLHITTSQRQTWLPKWSLLKIFKVITFSTRSMKKSLTSFVFVNFAAMLTRPLERFCSKRKKELHYKTIMSFHRRGYWQNTFKILSVCNVSHLEISLHLIKSFSLSSESCTDQTEERGENGKRGIVNKWVWIKLKIKASIFSKNASFCVCLLPFVLIQQIFVSD